MHRRLRLMAGDQAFNPCFDTGDVVGFVVSSGAGGRTK